MSEPSATWPWWLLPLLVGLVLSAGILLFGDLHPRLQTFYSFL